MPEPRDRTAQGPDALALALHRSHGQALRRWALQRFDDAQMADEVVQETLLMAWRKHGQFDPARGTERVWVFGIGRNVAATRYARNRRHLRSVPTETLPENPDPRDDIEHMAERSLVIDALHCLSDEHAAVVKAAFWEGMSTTEMASHLSIPEGTVKSRLYYALRNLRAALEEREVIS